MATLELGLEEDDTWKTFDERTTMLSGTEFNKLRIMLDQLRQITRLSITTGNTLDNTNGSSGNNPQYLCMEVIHTCMGEKIDVRILGEDKSLLSDLELRLRDELHMCYFIMNENPRNFDQRMRFDTRWHPDIHPNLASDDLMQLKRRIVWLTCELNYNQEDMLMMAFNDHIYMSPEPDDIIKINSPPCDMYHTSDCAVHAPQRILPLMRPLASDCKPNTTFETFTLIREFVFIERDMDPGLRFQLMGRLDAQQMDQLLTNPYDFFFAIVRCMAMSAQEFIDACFKYDKDGKPTGTTRCPCGVQLGVTDGGIRAHSCRCQFSEMVQERCPTILQRSLYSSCHEERALGWKEKAYIIDVIKKRMAKDEWHDTFLEDIGIRA